MNELAKSLAKELIENGVPVDEQRIANYIVDNSSWEMTLDYICAEKGNRGTTEALLDDFISDVMFYMEE